jgi:endo-1,4-beta-mannosidase
MDFYVRNFAAVKEHDQFYQDGPARAAFASYANTIVKRYSNHTGVFGWELANDARCHSTLPSSSKCNTNVVTRWHADSAKEVKRNDPNHIVSSGYIFLCSFFSTISNPANEAPKVTFVRTVPNFSREPQQHLHLLQPPPLKHKLLASVVFLNP